MIKYTSSYNCTELFSPITALVNLKRYSWLLIIKRNYQTQAYSSLSITFSSSNVVLCPLNCSQNEPGLSTLDT